MPKPYLSSKDIDGLMRTLPLLVYFPKSDWKNIRKAEEDNEEGIKLYKHFSKIYKDNFLKYNQESQKILYDQSKTQEQTSPTLMAEKFP